MKARDEPSWRGSAAGSSRLAPAPASDSPRPPREYARPEPSFGLQQPGMNRIQQNRSLPHAVADHSQRPAFSSEQPRIPTRPRPQDKPSGPRGEQDRRPGPMPIRGGFVERDARSGRDDLTEDEIEPDNLVPRKRNQSAARRDIFIPNTISVSSLAVTMGVRLRQSSLRCCSPRPFAVPTALADTLTAVSFLVLDRREVAVDDDAVGTAAHGPSTRWVHTSPCAHMHRSDVLAVFWSLAVLSSEDASMVAEEMGFNASVDIEKAFDVYPAPIPADMSAFPLRPPVYVSPLVRMTPRGST